MSAAAVRVGIVGLGTAIAAVAALVGVGHRGGLFVVADAAVAVPFLVLSALCWPARRTTAILATAAALSWALGSVLPVAAFWHRGVIIHLLVIEAGRRIPATMRIAVIAAGYALAAVPWVWASDAVAVITGGALGAVLFAGRRRVSPALTRAGSLLVVAFVGPAVLRAGVPGSDGVAAGVLVYAVAIGGVGAVLAWDARPRPLVRVVDLIVIESGGADPDRFPSAARERARRLRAANDELVAELRSAAAEVAASRARIVAARDAERSILTARLGEEVIEPLRALESGLSRAGPSHAEAAELAARARNQVEDIVFGLRPRELAAGLIGAIRAAAAATPLPVTLDLQEVTLDPATETTLHYVASEALANVARHSGAGVGRIGFRVADGRARLIVEDDGAGGAHPAGGSGLDGLARRVAARGGRLLVDSPTGGGTRIVAEIPVAGEPVATAAVVEGVRT